eukprot:6472025-Amphidinium_carterae.1
MFVISQGRTHFPPPMSSSADKRLQSIATELWFLNEPAGQNKRGNRKRQAEMKRSIGRLNLLDVRKSLLYFIETFREGAT